MMKRTRLRNVELERQLGQSLDVINSVTAAHDVTRADLAAARHAVKAWVEVAAETHDSLKQAEADLDETRKHLEAAQHWNRQLCALSQEQNAKIRRLTEERERARGVAVLLEGELVEVEARLALEKEHAEAARRTSLQLTTDDAFRDRLRSKLAAPVEMPQVVAA